MDENKVQKIEMEKCKQKPNTPLVTTENTRKRER